MPRFKHLDAKGEGRPAIYGIKHKRQAVGLVWQPEGVQVRQLALDDAAVAPQQLPYLLPQPSPLPLQLPGL